MSVIEKRRVTMRAAVATEAGVQIHEAIDYVPLDDLDRYVADAQTRWQSVTTSTEHDPGPDGDADTEPLEG